MGEISGASEVLEKITPGVENFKEIKPEGGMSLKEAREFISNLFRNIGKETAETKNIEKLRDKYIEDLKNRSKYPETIPDKPFDISDLKKLTPEESAKMRDDFDDKKEQLKRQWEEANGKPWPKYNHDVYSATGKLIRKKESDYDAHHIQPLSLGGKNEAGNITPLNAEVHYDKQGVHSPDSPYSKLEQIAGGMD